MAKGKGVAPKGTSKITADVKEVMSLNTQSQQTVVKEELADPFGGLFEDIDAKAVEFQIVVDAKNAFKANLDASAKQLVAAYTNPSIPFTTAAGPVLVEFGDFLKHIAATAAKSEAHQRALVDDSRIVEKVVAYAERQTLTFSQILEFVGQAKEFGLKDRAIAHFKLALTSNVVGAVLKTLKVKVLADLTTEGVEINCRIRRQAVGLEFPAKEKPAPKAPQKSFKATKVTIQPTKAVVADRNERLSKEELERCLSAAAGLQREALVRGWVAQTKDESGKSRYSTVEGTWGDRNASPWVVADKSLGTNPKDMAAALMAEAKNPKAVMPKGILAKLAAAEKWVAKMEAAR